MVIDTIPRNLKSGIFRNFTESGIDHILPVSGFTDFSFVESGLYNNIPESGIYGNFVEAGIYRNSTVYEY
jgi:hypothetical protein